MPMFTPTDVPIYAPSVTLTGDALLGLIDQAIAIAQSPVGSNRPLEVSQFREILPVTRYKGHIGHRYCRLSYSPVVEIEEVRIRSLAPIWSEFAQWDTLASNDYALDLDGRLRLKNSRMPYRGFRLSYLESSEVEAEIAYTAGLDFTADAPEVRAIKSALGALMGFLDSAPAKGVSEVTVPFREFTLKYEKTDGLVKVPDRLLVEFKKYAPVFV